MKALVFPKFLQSLSAGELATALAGVGADGVAMPVREGFWVSPSALAGQGTAFITAMAAAGLTVPYAIIPETWESLARDPTPLATLADLGIRQVRVGYLRNQPDMRAAIASGRRAVDDVAGHARRLGVRVVMQLHHGTLHPSPSAAWLLISDTDPAAIGVKVDPGNQVHEGWEQPARSLDLLGVHLAAVGAKDAAVLAQGDGWQRPWVPLPGGAAGWREWATALRARAFAGTCVFSPFYLTGPAERERHLAALAGEIRWLRQALQAEMP